MAFIKEIQTPDNIKHQIKNTIIPVVGTQTVPSGGTGIGQWTGNIDIPSLYDGLTIAYFLPCAGSGNATLELTLSDGSTTGPINCYYSSGRLTTHYAKGMNIIMTYWSAGSISIDGTPTTDDRWIAQGNYADGNNKVDQGNTTTSNWRHIILGYASWTTTEPATTNVQQVVYKNNNIKISPAYGRLFLKGSTPQQYMVDTTFDLTASNNGVSGEQWRALRFLDKNENNISLFINSVNTNTTASIIRTYNKSTDGATSYDAWLAVQVTKSGEQVFSTSQDTLWRSQSSEIDRDGTAPSSKIIGKNIIKIADKNGENVGLIRIAQDTDSSTELQLINSNENTSGTEVYNIIKLITAKDGTCSYYVSDGPAFRTAIGATDTKNTAGSTDTSSKIYLIGATEQSANPQTYSDDQVYVTNGSLYLTKTTDASGTADNKPALIIGNPTGQHLELDTNEIMCKNSGTTTGDLYINNDGGTVCINNKLATRWTSTPTAAQNEQITVIDGTSGQIKAGGYSIQDILGKIANAVHFIGSFDPSTTEGTINSGTDTLKTVKEEKGDLYIASAAGTFKGLSFEIGDSIIFIEEVAENTAVTSSDFVQVEGTTDVSNSGPTLDWGNTYTIGTVDGTDLTVTMPSNPNINTTYSLSRNNKEIVLTGSDNSTSSVDAARAALLTNEDLNTVVLPGFYNAGGSNTCANTPNPSSTSGFGLMVLHTASSTWYYQLFNYCGTTTTYRRSRNGTSGVWTDWKEEKITDENTKQTLNSESKIFPLLFSKAETSNTNTDITNGTLRNNSVYIKPSSGYIYSNVGGFCAGYLTPSEGKRTWMSNNGITMNNYLGTFEGTAVAPYERNVLKSYSGKCPGNNGQLITLDSGGLTIIGGGESAQNLAGLIADDQTVTSPARLDVNNSQSASGKETTSFMGESEHLILSSDYNIYFATNCNTVGNRVAVCLDNNRIFYPMTNNSGKIGSSSYRWKYGYFGQIITNGLTGLWKEARDRAAFRVDVVATTNSYAPALDLKTTSGDWSIGALGGEENLYFSYLADSIYSGTENKANKYRLNAPSTPGSSTYDILHSGNTSFTQSLSSGTKIGTIKINGTSTDLYCETNTNTAQATGYANVVKSDDFSWSAGTLPSLTTKSTTIYPVKSTTTTASKIVSKDTTIYPVKSTTTTATKVTTKSTTIYPVTSTTTTASKVVSKDTTIYPVTSSTTTASKVVSKDTTIYPVKSSTTTATKVTTSSTTFDQITGVGTLPTLTVSGITLELNQGTLPTSSSVTINDVVSNTDVTVPILSSSVTLKQISSISDVTVPILSSSVTLKQISSISDVTVPILSSSVSITEISSTSDVTVPILSSSVTIKEISSNTDVTVPVLSSSVTISEVSNWSAGTLPSLSWGSVSAVTGVST